MKTVDTTHEEVRFTAHWGGRLHYCFIRDATVNFDAGRKLNRDAAVEYVRANLARYTAEARAQHGEDNCDKIVIMHRLPG